MLIFDDKEVDLTHFLVSVAELLAGGGDVTHREIELWIEHMRPVWLTGEMPLGFLRFAEAMFREGLTTTTPQEYARFVTGEMEVTD